jgi:2-polyprenyl-3-methyl-5-hydroxy-6-metoxy-1,4-benzoquinol methylase
MNVAPSQMLHVPAISIAPLQPANQSNLTALRGQRQAPDEVERLEALLRDVEDVSELSPELLRRAIAENCWYHVTPFRSALIRTLELPANSRILEVGCGAGALTRYLGERGFQVVALETSSELAECARIRCKDLSNVEIVTGFLEEVVVDQKFDFVVCVDPVFAEGEFSQPALQLLAMCRKVLKATGTLILSVANSLHSMGAAHVEPSRNHMRGASASLESLKQALGSAGFSHSEHYITFPNHAAPRLLIDPEQARKDRVAWVGLIEKLYQTSEAAAEEVQRWWRGICGEGLESSLAPGWLILAHAHSVHSVLWNSKAGKYFVPLAEGASPEEEAVAGIETSPIVISQPGIVAAILQAGKPEVNSLRDYKASLKEADSRIGELVVREAVVSDQLREVQDALIQTEDRHATEMLKEQEGRRIREAELGLVLKQYHAVGAMCHDMREEGRKLKSMLDELRRRYVASEEWGAALSKRVAEAEAELQQTKDSVGYKMVEKAKGWLQKFGLFRTQVDVAGRLAAMDKATSSAAEVL